MINIMGKMAKFKYNLLGVVYLFLQFLSKKKKSSIEFNHKFIDQYSQYIYIYIILLKDD